MLIMQYMSIQQGSLMTRLLQKALRLKSVIIFDLEDTLSDLDPKKSRSVKAWGRAELAALAHSHPDLFRNKPVGIRMNGLRSGELERDLETVAAISQVWDLYHIVGPKIESRQCIHEYIHGLKNKDVRYKTFIPVIETVEGMKRLSSIVGQEGIENAFYGHYDYSLDCGHWPFLEQDQAKFWQIVSRFISNVETANVRYIHPPVGFFCNMELMAQVWIRLQARCRLPFGVVTVNSAQTAFLNRLMNAPIQRDIVESCG